MVTLVPMNRQITLETLIKLLEDDADAILKFMASNGLVANCKKTVFMLLNHKQGQDAPAVKIRVGTTLLEQEKSTKLLGMTIEDNQLVLLFIGFPGFI